MPKISDSKHGTSPAGGDRLRQAGNVAAAVDDVDRGRRATRRRPRRPDLFSPGVWKGLTVEQCKLAALVIQGRHVVWITGSWCFSPEWAAATGADLDLALFTETEEYGWERHQITEFPVGELKFAKTGSLYSDAGEVVCQAFVAPHHHVIWPADVPAAAAATPTVRIVNFTESNVATKVIHAHRYMMSVRENLGFQHKRNRIAFLSKLCCEF